MELDNVLQQLKSLGKTGMSKTAEPKENQDQGKEAAAQKELETALSSALNQPAKEKTAMEKTSASVELVKLATDLAGAEQEALVKQAHLYGAAVADGFVSRLQQYQAAATKVASDESQVTEEAFNKFAAENPELVKQAMQMGYQDAQEQIAALKKTAEVKPAPVAKTAETDTLDKIAAFKAGYNETIKQAEKLAADCESRGYNDTLKVLQAL